MTSANEISFLMSFLHNQSTLDWTANIAGDQDEYVVGAFCLSARNNVLNACILCFDGFLILIFRTSTYPHPM